MPSKSGLQLDFNVPIRFEQDVVGRPPHAHEDENPGVTGTLKLRFDEGLTEAKYKLYVHFSPKSSAEASITMAHLHAAPAGDIGELVVILFESDPPVRKDGLLKKGTITNSDIRSVTADNSRYNTVSTLYSSIRADTLYVDIHGTGKYLPGMLRGQIYTQ